MASIQEKIEKRNIGARRKLFDNGIRLIGIETNTVRLKIVEDKYGDETQTIVSQDNIVVRIVYPPELPIDRYRADFIPGDAVESSHTFFYEVLPIEVYSQWTDNIEKGDLLVHKVLDEQANPIKILLKMSETLATFQTEVFWKKMYAAPYNGVVPIEIQTIIDAL